MIWRDGSAWNYGKFDDPARPEYSYRREVDYVSGAALMVPRDLFWEVGGFDEHYLPAYYEDVDLALAVREAGRSVVFQPLSQIVHHEGATSGTDLTSGSEGLPGREREKAGHALAAAAECAVRAGTVRLPGDASAASGFACSYSTTARPSLTRTRDPSWCSRSCRCSSRSAARSRSSPEDNYLFLERYTTDLQRLGIECLYAPFVTSVQQYLRQRGDAFDLVLIFRFTAASRHLGASGAWRHGRR